MFITMHSFGDIVVGVLIGILLTASFSFPRVGRAVGKTVSVVLLSLGAGLITWGIFGLVAEDGFKPMEFGPILFSSSAQALGWGAGSLCGGLTALVLSFTGRIAK
jgi:uncharacterized membrane protein